MHREAKKDAVGGEEEMSPTTMMRPTTSVKR
jgi:hypothetical protein